MGRGAETGACVGCCADSRPSRGRQECCLQPVLGSPVLGSPTVSYGLGMGQADEVNPTPPPPWSQARHCGWCECVSLLVRGAPFPARPGRLLGIPILSCCLRVGRGAVCLGTGWAGMGLPWLGHRSWRGCCWMVAVSMIEAWAQASTVWAAWTPASRGLCRVGVSASLPPCWLWSSAVCSAPMCCGEWHSWALSGWCSVARRCWQ